MKSIIYRYSRRFFLTSEITRRIESRIFILYPSTRYSVINRTAEYLIKIYILAGIVTTGLFLYADFSLYYATISALVVYAVVNSRVYGELDKLEIRLLMQFEKFITDVKFRFQFDGMLEEALQDAINYAEYEMSLQGEKILECLQNYYRKENEDYTEIASNQFFLSFYSICLMNRQYGDKKESGQSIFVRNLGYLKEEVNIELLKRRKMNHEFMGLTALTILPVFAIKPIEHWALHYMPEMENRYCGTQGMMATVLLMIFTIAVYKLISVLKRMNHSEKYKNKWVEQWSQSDRINRFICLYLAHRKKSAEKLNRLVRETGYAYNLAELILLRYMDGMLYMLLTAGLGTGTGVKGIFLALLLPVGFITGYYSRYIAILIKKQILIMEREEEIVRFQTIILMVMHMDRITIQEILKRMENFAAIFKEEIYELSNQISCRGINIFRDAKGRNGFVPYEKLLDGFIACDTMPVYRAFEDVESDRNYYVEKHKQDNEQIISQKAMIAKTVSFLPLCMVIIIKLILPFVVQGITGLSMDMTL